MSAAREPSTATRTRAAWWGAVIGASVLVAIGLTASFQLSPYAGRPSPGFSFDTPYYVWRTNLVAAEGTSALASFPPATNGNPDRPGFPVLGAVVDAVTGVDALTFVILIRAIAAIAIGSAAAGVAIATLGHPPWCLPLFLIGLGCSAAITGTAIGSVENLLADAPLMALAAAATLWLHGRPARWAIPLLIAAAAIVHWVFAALFAALLVAVGVLSPFVGREGGSARRQLVRAAQIAGLLVLGGAFAIAVMPALPDTPPPVVVTHAGNAHRVPLYELPILLPLALAGFVVTFPRASATSKTALSLFGLWAASVPLAIAASIWTPQPLKIFRVAPFALGIPVLVVAGLVVLIRTAGRRWRIAGAALGIAVAGVILGIALPPQVGPFNDRSAAKITRRLEDGRTIGRYLSDLDPHRGAVIVASSQGPILDRTIRAGVPPAWIRGLHVYLGDPAELLRGRPTVDPSHPNRSALWREWWLEAWPDPQPILARDPILLGLRAPAWDRGTPTPLTRDVVVLRGPPPRSPVAGAVPIEVGWSRALWLCGLILLVLGTVGYGWTRALMDVPRLAAIALAPAVGIAVLVVPGSLAARLGIAPGGGAGIAIAAGALIVGIAARAFRIAVERRAGDDTAGDTGGLAASAAPDGVAVPER